MAQRDSAAVIASIARERQTALLQAIDSLDTKAASLIGFAGIILTLEFTSSVASRWNKGLSAGAVILVLAIVALGAALIPRRYHTHPNVAGLAAGFMDVPEDETLEVVAKSIVRALDQNTEKMRWKVRFVKAGAFLAVLGIVVSGAGLLYSVESGQTHGQDNQSGLHKGHQRGNRGP